MNRTAAEAWDSGDAYEQYVGRWSRKVATEFLRWLALPPGFAWADVGCGTGALASTILATCEPSSIHGIDSSEGFVSQARQRIRDPRTRFETGDATHLPWDSAVLRAAVRTPYPSVDRFRDMQRIMARHDPKVLIVKMEDLVDDRLVRKLDASGVVDRLYSTYDVK